VQGDWLRRSITGADELVVCDGKTARVRAVTLGTRAGATVEIATGLKPGEQVVTDHALGLDDGQALQLGGAAPAKATD
jgi:multidrug efflux system membrane fusion protein